MVGKYFLFAFACVLLAQVQGESVEESIRRALEQVKNLSLAAERKVENGIREFNFRRNSISLATTSFLQRELKVEEQARLSLIRIADQIREKAKETNKPPATIECINKAEAQAIKNIEPFSSQFEAELRKLEKTNLAALEQAGQPLEGLKQSLKGRLEDATKRLRACKNNTSVNKTLDAIRKEYDSVFAEVSRIYTRMTQIYNNYKKDANVIFGNVSNQVRKIQYDGIRTIKQCLYQKA